MIVTNNQSPGQPSSNVPTAGENVQLRHNPPVQLRRADSNKSGPNNVPLSGNLANNLSSPNMGTGRAGKPRPSQFQHNVTGNVTSVSSPSLLHSPGPSAPPTVPHHVVSGPLPCTFHFACSRYLLFLVYLLLLLSLIVNTFLHFLIFGSNMLIGALFLDVHHRYELVSGDYGTGYYSLDKHVADFYLTLENWAHTQSHQGPTANQLHCDRDAFLSLLDDFYHHPKDKSYDSDESHNTPTDQLYNRLPPTSRKPYPKIFATFNNKEQSRQQAPSSEEEQLYHSSSSTSARSYGDPSRRLIDDLWKRQKSNEQRLLIFEVAALILLFIFVLVQIVGLVAVMRKHQFLLVLVTSINSILFCLLVYVANYGLLSLLLLAVFCGFWFVLQMRLGARKCAQRQRRLKEEIGNEMRDVISQSGARLTPCVHVSMEQYEAMTQQMLHRYSSPIVYCPHYNESLC